MTKIADKPVAIKTNPVPATPDITVRPPAAPITKLALEIDTDKFFEGTDVQKMTRTDKNAVFRYDGMALEKAKSIIYQKITDDIEVENK